LGNDACSLKPGNDLFIQSEIAKEGRYGAHNLALVMEALPTIEVWELPFQQLDSGSRMGFLAGCRIHHPVCV
jgi:hypothetical protein